MSGNLSGHYAIGARHAQPIQLRLEPRKVGFLACGQLRNAAGKELDGIKLQPQYMAAQATENVCGLPDVDNAAGAHEVIDAATIAGHREPVWRAHAAACRVQVRLCFSSQASMSERL